MHNETLPKKVLASAIISELQSSDMYLTLIARLFDLRANLNGVRVTEAFLDEIVENEAKYICHPLYADIRGLIANKTVGHMYNARTGQFHSTQIGAFYHFEKETDGDNTYLLGYARVPKRNKALCKVLSDLFTDNALKFSFEVNCGVYEQEADGTMVIDADARNYWEGECVVTFPACETAIAKQLVAECLGKGDDHMADENIVQAEIEVAEQTTEVVAETETVVDENVEVVAETETAERIYVTRNHVEHDSMTAYDPENGQEIEQRVTVETTTRDSVEIAEEEADVEEDQTENETEVTAESEVSAECDTDDEDKTECGSATSTLDILIAELKGSIEALRKEIAELKNTSEDSVEIIAEASESDADATVTAESITGDVEQQESFVNPFMASISVPKKYSLLDKDEKTTHKYSLLERA